ncbi:hypothetical protein [Thermoflavimicrobium daqui]|uniref:Lipoprotein n=1 Tax=Thermoflavimicrobium daqui TaxID=2137476 RepID=A0A364K7R1_9BACL|nr:hypothetical protein [Thermoflavimicrobium daqui]RAL26327.1 hypothetical protein DL897_04845 [Thermoflavimicrobium daqui]
MSLRNDYVVILIIVVGLITGCSKPVVMERSTQPMMTFVKNESSYEAYLGNESKEDSIDSFYLNLAFNHTPDITFDSKKIGVELLPKTNIVQQTSVSLEENPPQGKLKQKALSIRLKTNQLGKHVFTQIRINTEQHKKVYDLGKIRVQVRRGSFSGITVLTESAGVFPHSKPLIIALRNANDHSVSIKGILLNNPNIQFNHEHIKVGHSFNQAFPPLGYELKPNETLPIKVDWKVQLPANQTINMEARPLVVTQYKQRLEYAGIPNMIFRNDF